ncbi:2739_t:CDS:2 [Dentiscutata erythropus]|uniref:Phosphatidylglycerol/phosphatidylinositol transfer protein n=1 Tax=Dentiscutata erythropus TaxID=1348616 RepID=A0A9N8W3X4_9GLOM|nr:2739_t:CDS:2 [Dentiscutata erythropus]
MQLFYSDDESKNMRPWSNTEIAYFSMLCQKHDRDWKLISRLLERTQKNVIIISMRQFFAILIFLTLITFTISFPSPTFRRNSHSDFTQCEGTFPNEITTVFYEPNPAISGENMTVTIAGINTVTVQEGATLNVTALYQGKQAFVHIMDFCKVWVEVNGDKCPVSPGDFKYTVTIPIEPHQDDPKNTTIGYDYIFQRQFMAFTNRV